MFFCVFKKLPRKKPKNLALIRNKMQRTFLLTTLPLLLFCFQSSSQAPFTQTLRIINTMAQYSSSPIMLQQNDHTLFSFTGLWASSYSTISFDSSKSLFLNISNISLTVPNLTSASYLDHISLIIYEGLPPNDVTSLLIKSDDFSTIFGSDNARWSLLSLSRQFPVLELYSQNSDCYKCMNIYTDIVEFLSNQAEFISYMNKTTHQFYIYLLSESLFEPFHIDIDENGIYTYILLDSNYPDHPFELIQIIDSKPDKVWVPCVVAMFILIGICILRVLANFFYDRYKKNKEKNLIKDREDLQPLNAPGKSLSQVEIPQKKLGSFRVESLDVFRGISLVIMIFVNYGGGNYWFFNHSTWNGLTVADLVFPWFIWIMGTSMALSFDKLQKTKPSKDFNHLDFIYKIIRRGILLFLLGMFLNNGYDLGNWRIPGVLQRFGIGYLLIALIVSYVPKLDVIILKPLKDILDYSLQWILMLLILMAYLLITYVSKLEGCPRGYVGPGGLGDYGQYPHCTGGVALYLDQEIFGYDHIFTNPTTKDVYKTGMFDPEGFLGNFTSIFLTFTGYQCGRILINYKNDKDKLIRWILWGLILAGIGTGLCGASKNEGIMPLNKNLWSVSFILLLGGLAFLCIALCYYIVDMKKWWLGWPFIYVGRNSIAIYMGHEILQGYFPFSFLNNQDHSMALLNNCLGVAIWMWIAWKMNEEGVFIKV